jgi:hypothetical protein
VFCVPAALLLKCLKYTLTRTLWNTSITDPYQYRVATYQQPLQRDPFGAVPDRIYSGCDRFGKLGNVVHVRTLHISCDCAGLCTTVESGGTCIILLVFGPTCRVFLERMLDTFSGAGSQSACASCVQLNQSG